MANAIRDLLAAYSALDPNQRRQVRQAIIMPEPSHPCVCADGTYGELEAILMKRYGWDEAVTDGAINTLDCLAHAHVFEDWE